MSAYDYETESPDDKDKEECKHPEVISVGSPSVLYRHGDILTHEGGFLYLKRVRLIGWNPVAGRGGNPTFQRDLRGIWKNR